MTKKPVQSFVSRIRSFYTSKLWRGRLILAFIIITVVLTIVRISLPHTIIFGATSWLKQQGITSTIESININIINGTVSLVNATGSKDTKPLFNIGLIEIHWHWAPLSEKTIVITKVELDRLNINLEMYTDTIIVGGVHIPLVTTAKENITADSSDNSVKPWAASLGEVVFSELNICYLQHTAPLDLASDKSRYIDYCVGLDEMIWGGTISYGTDSGLVNNDDLPLSSTGNFSLNGLSVTDNKLDKKLLTSSSNTLKNVVISGLNSIKIDAINMSGLSALQRNDKKHKDAVRFQQLLIKDIHLTGLNSLSVTDIRIREPGLYLVKNDGDYWEYQQWIPQTSAANQVKGVSGDAKSDTSPSTFKVTTANISVENIDSCYLQKDTGLYYCLVFDELKWDGKIQYDTSVSQAEDLNLTASGSLKLSTPNIQNMSIDRTLVNFSALTLSNINLAGLNSITLDSLELNRLSALQRSKDDDDYTAAFEDLTINDISYTKNSITIDSVHMDGLASAISKNKNGQWEHDKWILESKTNQPDNSTKAKTVTDDTSTSYTVALNKIDISSDKNILFTDNSTQPATKAGLQKITLTINNLYTNKPDTDSAFNLHAKTTRHSTIDIKGTARPFAEKVSLDADGKLKGFDLRAASPTTKKAIGHIIQSGQLDADLDLRAIDGILDSNIALSLYHFKIKPESKEDAEKLDAKFGMPLNQTLVLLRDKDDSIHLDIPITGDVNNPEFNPMDAIIKATSKAATVTLITFYTPYGLIYAGGNIAFNLATALNFDPIDFSPGSPDISTGSKEQLDGLSKLLTEKPQVHLTLCGITNNQDTYILYPELKPEVKKTDDEKGKNLAELQLTQEQILKLDQLAVDRQVNSKNYLINEHGIEHDRLILCEPEHRKGDDDISGVEVNI